MGCWRGRGGWCEAWRRTWSGAVAVPGAGPGAAVLEERAGVWRWGSIGRGGGAVEGWWWLWGGWEVRFGRGLWVGR